MQKLNNNKNQFLAISNISQVNQQLEKLWEDIKLLVCGIHLLIIFFVRILPTFLPLYFMKEITIFSPEIQLHYPNKKTFDPEYHTVLLEFPEPKLTSSIHQETKNIIITINLLEIIEVTPMLLGNGKILLHSGVVLEVFSPLLSYTTNLLLLLTFIF